MAAFGAVGCSGEPTQGGGDTGDREPTQSKQQEQSGSTSGSERPDKPNIVFILTDDQTVEDMRYMPITRELLGDKGTTFENAFVTDSVCCPSRATILRGQYMHNHQIKGAKPPAGGWEMFRDRGLDQSTIATWLQDDGYRTTYVGKYLNIYRNTTYVPPGWDDWYALDGAGYFDFEMNENGETVSYEGRDDYQTDVFGEKATQSIRQASDAGEPFFLHLSPYAPHGPVPEPAPRHEGMFEGEKAPRPPSFNEADVSDKPEWVRRMPMLTEGEIREIDEWYRNRLGTLQAVDETVRDVVDTLEETGELDNTYIVFTTDNGWHMGQHRLTPSKTHAYEEDIRVPLLVRGPGVPEGRSLEHLVLNNDFAPTFAEIGGAQTPDFIDGRSLMPLLERDPVPTEDWRQSFLVEAKSEGAVDQRPAYKAIRTERRTYVSYANDRYASEKENELYNLRKDPYQLNSLDETANPGLLRRLRLRLIELARCEGEECRVAENKEIAP
jgi:arylsulfatase A-like enzyme